MGKVKHGRHKLHSAAVKPKPNVGSSKIETLRDVETAPLSPGGIFSKLDIDINALERQTVGDADFDTKSSVTSKSIKGLRLKKKDKKKLRHEFWMKKMDVLQATKKEAKAKKQRQRTPVVGDMKPLQDTLPTLQLLLRETQQEARPTCRSEENEEKSKPIKREKQRLKDMMNDVSLFQQVLQHPAFKANPLTTVSEHLHNKMKQEQGLQC